MTTFFLYLTTLALTSGFELEGSGVVRSAVFVDQSGLLRMVRTDTGAVQWTAEIGGPLVWAEGLKEGQQVQFFPRLNGDLLVQKDQSGIRKMERGVKDLARAGETEFDWEYYFKGSVSSSTFSMDVRTGSPDPLPSSHCPSLLIHRITYSLSLIDKRDLKSVSELYVSEIATSGCLKPGNVERIAREYGAVWVLGEYVAEEEGWGKTYPVSLGVFLLFALYVGFKLGRKEAGKGVNTPACRSPQCGLVTPPSITPKRSAASSPQPPLYRAKADLTVVTTKRMPRDSLEQETPLIPSSDTRIHDLVSNGRFQATFERVHLVHEQDGQRVYEARHILEGRKYVVKVAKFEYDETKSIAQVEMFREVAAMMRFRHKNVVNYVTSWVEDTDIQPPNFPLSPQITSEDSLSPSKPSISTGYLYIQSELIEGKSLEERLAERKEVDRLENCLLFRQMLKGVAHIHSKRIVHRGLEPACLYVTGGKTVKIGGFHLAAKARASRHSFFQNTSIYSDLSTGLETNFPEQRDIYPLGLVLLEMCANQQKSREEMNVLLSNSKEKGEIPAEMGKEMRAEMEIVRWLTAEKPEKRPSALELLSSSLMRDWEREVGLSPSPVGLSPAHGPQ